MTGKASLPWRSGDGCVILRVRLTPKSSKDAVDGVTATTDGAVVCARVRAVPENGAANRALQRLIAGWLAMPKSAVELSGGGKARVKSLTIRGDTAGLECRLAEKLKELRDNKQQGGKTHGW